MWRDSERRGMRDVLGIAIVLASSLCIAFVPSSAKISMNEGASLMMLLVSRCLIGAGLLLPLTLVQRQKLLVPRALLRRTIIATLFNIGMIGCLYSAIQFVDVGLAVLILYMFPLGIAIWSHASGRQRLNVVQWGAVAALLAGLVLLMFDTVKVGRVDGLLLCFGSMICAMVYTTMSSDLTDNLGSAVVNLHTNIWSVVILILAVILPLGQTIALPQTASGWLAIASNGTFYMLGYWLFFEGCRLIGVTRASILTLVDPLLAAAVAILFLGQFLTISEAAGFAIILAALVLFETRKSRSSSA